MGTGGACGAIFLSQNFEGLLKERLAAAAKSEEVLTPKRLSAAVKHFEGELKFKFNLYDEDVDNSFEFPLPGAPDIPDIGLEGGTLTIKK